MLIDYKNNIIKLELDEEISATFKYIDKTIIELSFKDPKRHEITLIDTSLNTIVKHFHNSFYINWLDSYTIYVNGKAIYIIKPILQHELIKI
jgi:hypothetical protein